MIGDARAKVGQRLTIPLTIDEAQSIQSGQFTITCDPRLFKPIRVLMTPLGAGDKLEQRIQDGELRFGFAGAHSVTAPSTTDSRPLVELEVEVLPTAPRGEVSTLTLREAILNESRSVVRKGGSIEILPDQTVLLQNYPNPFNPETWIPFHLAEDASVTLTIDDTTGAVVRTLPVGHKPAAVYESKGKAIYWDGRNDFGERVASGIYFYTLTANDFIATRKMLILK